MSNRNNLILAVAGSALMMLQSCHEETPSRLPQVITNEVSKILETSAKSGGNVVSDGGNPILAKGICWSTSTGPTIADGVYDAGPGPGHYDAFLTGLNVTTVYYVRAFATNKLGTAYGSEYSFKTQTPLPQVTTGTVFDRQGHVYTTKKLGMQNWMTENLKATIFLDGTRIPFERGEKWHSLNGPGMCWVLNDDSRTIVYGDLYNFYSVADSRNVCPQGWHVPSIDEWNAMINFLGGDDVAGGKMKEAGLSHWAGPNEGATNSSGFDALPAGLRGQLDYADFSLSGNYWTSTSTSEGLAQMESIRYSNGGIFAAQYSKATGASVRCIQNE